jgi:uncharacterized protein DUF3822
LDKSYTLKKKIKDDKFNIDELENYCLSLLVGTEDFLISIIDIRTNQCLLIEDFRFSPNSEVLEVIKKIFAEHHLLEAGFWNNIKIAFKNQQFTIVPTSLFNTNQGARYLGLAVNIDEQKDEVLYYKHIKADCTSVFSVEKEVVEFFKEVYKNLKVHFLHESSIFIEGVLRHDDHTELKSMFISFGENYFQVVVTEKKKLIYYNRFQMSNPEQVLKYIMIVTDQLGLDQESTKVLVWGNIDSVSDKFSILYQYIRNISFGNKPSYIKSGYVFDSLQEHNYFNLMSIYPCD